MLLNIKHYRIKYLIAALGVVGIVAIIGSFLIGSGESEAVVDASEKLISIAHGQVDKQENKAGFFSYSISQIKEMHVQQVEQDKIDSLVQKDSTQHYPDRTTAKLKRKSTLADLLSKHGMSSSASYALVESMKAVHNPRSLKAGQKFTLFHDKIEGKRTIVGLKFSPDVERHIIVLRDNEGAFQAQEIVREFNKTIVSKQATINTALSVDGQKAGIPYSALSELIAAYSWDVDFQRDIQKGDTVEVVFESLTDEDGRFVKTGDLIYANLTLRNDPIEIWRFEMANGDVDYFKRDGKSVRRALMRTPIDGARLSSSYGMRKHPILGYNKMHKGVDFAAPIGTPIYAAGDGVIEVMGRKGGYGKYMRIRHREGLKTAYAHLNGYAKGMHKGKRVKQKQVIAYLGNTGRSTGPHLHYEVHLNGRQTNPRTVKLPKGKALKGSDFNQFTSYIDGFSNTVLANARLEGEKFALNKAQ